MGKPIKNWKLLESGINGVDALNSLETQTYKGKEGIYAIKSENSGRFITPFNCDANNSMDKATKMSIFDIKSSWMVLVPDDEREKLTNEIAQLLKRSNWTDMTYQEIDHINLPKMWKNVSEKIGDDEKLIYKVMKWFFEKEMYKNK